MFINKQLLIFMKNSFSKLVSVSFVDALLTIMASLIMLLSSAVIQFLFGKKQFLFFTSIIQIFIVIFLLIIIRFVLSKKKTVEAMNFSTQIKKELREKLILKLYNLGYAYTSKKRTGDLVTTLWNRVEWLNNYYNKYLPVAISTIINSIFILYLICRIDFFVGMVALVFTILVFVVPMLFYKHMEKQGILEGKESSKYYSDCLDAIQGLNTLKALNANDIQLDKVKRQGEVLRRSIMKHLNITIAESSVLELLVRLGYVFSILTAVFRFVNLTITSESLIYMVFLVSSLFMPMFNLMTAWHIGYRGVTAAISVFELLNDKENLSYSYSGLKDKVNSIGDKLEDDIVFSNVNFSYNQIENVIKNLNFTIKKDQVTALVGASGSGKSTIAHLLSGFYKVKSGDIRIGQIRLDENSVGGLTDLISAVWQEPHIFYGSFYENILMGNPHASREEVIKAAKDANIHEMIINLKEGYETIVGERGMRLSGGEKQRVAIARAFLRNTQILIFDEATSAIDRKTEREIQASFNKLAEGKTVLIIAHRLETIKNADTICVLDKGEIIDYGTHGYLSKNSEIYAELLTRQGTDNL